MKRSLIVVQQQPYDWEAAKLDIAKIAGHFASYLGEYRSKRPTGSKHTVLGPVGKLLNKAIAGERNLESLLGYTVRIHEMSSKKILSPNALENLRLGAEGLLNLLSAAPVAVRGRLVEQIDDAVYYQHQKRFYNYIFEKRDSFIAFLRVKYSSEEAFRQAWDREAAGFDEVRYPSKNQQQKARSKNKVQDIKEFWESLRETPVEDEGEEIE